MAALRQEQRYGLCSGSNSRSNSSRTLFHVKLTDTALRALEAYQNLKGTIPKQPSICFKGSQGYIKIPAPTAESLSALRVFSFYLSSDSKDQPQASFDCIHQYVASDGREQLEGQGIIQDKITVCATEDSYQVTRERMSQVEKDSWSRSAIEIKPGVTHPSKSVKIHKRPAAPPPPFPPPSSDSSSHKQSSYIRRNSTVTTATSRPLRERIIHLLALKPYRKPELLLWLERERVCPKDKAELSPILEEVAKVNPKDSSYLLRDDFYRHVQRDWPGYSEEERQLVSRRQARSFDTLFAFPMTQNPAKLVQHWMECAGVCQEPRIPLTSDKQIIVVETLNSQKLQLQIGCQARNLQANAPVLKFPEDSTTKNPAVKRPVPFDSLERLAAKRQRLVEQRSLQQQPTVNRLLNTKGHDSASPVLTKTDIQRTANLAVTHNSSPGVHTDLPVAHKLSSTSDTPIPGGREQETKVCDHQASQEVADCTHQRLHNNQHKKKKKHKDKERIREADWTEKSPDLKLKPDKLDDADITDSLASEEKPDYVLTYSPILSLEQRTRYQEDFCAEYDEYKDLHSRIATITHMFVKLGSKIKSLSPGTEDYKIMEDQILEKYNKYRKKFPGYREEKKRCEYLHEKLSYIKQLIVDFDLSHAAS